MTELSYFGLDGNKVDAGELLRLAGEAFDVLAECVEVD